MSRYDGLIIPRSYSEYINKTDAATLQQALQLSGVLSGAVAAGDNKAVTSNAVNGALANYATKGDLANYATKGDLAEYTAIPYLSFNPTSKVWSWHEYNKYNTSKPMIEGQLVAIFIEEYLKNTYWSADTTGVVTYRLQNTNGEKPAKTKCIGILTEDSFIDIIS